MLKLVLPDLALRAPEASVAPSIFPLISEIFSILPTSVGIEPKSKALKMSTTYDGTVFLLPPWRSATSTLGKEENVSPLETVGSSILPLRFPTRPSKPFVKSLGSLRFFNCLSVLRAGLKRGCSGFCKMAEKSSQSNAVLSSLRILVSVSPAMSSIALLPKVLLKFLRIAS